MRTRNRDSSPRRSPAHDQRGIAGRGATSRHIAQECGVPQRGRGDAADRGAAVRRALRVPPPKRNHPSVEKDSRKKRSSHVRSVRAVRGPRSCKRRRIATLSPFVVQRRLNAIHCTTLKGPRRSSAALPPGENPRLHSARTEASGDGRLTFSRADCHGRCSRRSRTSHAVSRYAAGVGTFTRTISKAWTHATLWTIDTNPSSQILRSRRRRAESRHRLPQTSRILAIAALPRRYVRQDSVSTSTASRCDRKATRRIPSGRRVTSISSATVRTIKRVRGIDVLRMDQVPRPPPLSGRIRTRRERSEMILSLREMKFRRRVTP